MFKGVFSCVYKWSTEINSLCGHRRRQLCVVGAATNELSVLLPSLSPFPFLSPSPFSHSSSPSLRPHPLPFLRSRPHVARGLGERLSFPSESGGSPAAKLFFGGF